MATITTEVDVEVDLEDFDYDEIIDEIKDRLNPHNKSTSEREKKEIMKELKNIVGIPAQSKNNVSLLDAMKIEFFMENINEISLEKLESLLQKSAA